MDKFQNTYRIPSARATWHDYAGGVYFVTLCTANMHHYFGEIANGQMQLSAIGQEAENCLREIPQHFPHVEVPLWVVMPNHIHGIIVINPVSVETQNFASLQTSGNQFGPQRKNLASVIRGFKIGVTTFAHQNNLSFAWQPRFYDRIVRDQDELNRTAEYIENNVTLWQMDANNQ